MAIRFPVGHYGNELLKKTEAIEGAWYPLLSIIGASIIGTASAFVVPCKWFNYKLIVIVIGWSVVIVSLILWVNKVRWARRIRALEETSLILTSDQQEALLSANYDLVSGFLASLYTNPLNLGDGKRISLFMKRDHGLTLVGRHAPNPLHNRRGKSVYALDVGFIGKAWINKQRYIDSDFPDPDQDGAGYLGRHKDLGFSDEEIQSFTMNSRSYLAQALLDDGQSPIAVLVVEDLAAGNQFNTVEAYLDELDGYGLKFLSNLFAALRKIIPTLSGEEGN